MPGQTRYYPHVLTVGNLTSVFNLAASSNRGWQTTIYEDVNGNGLKDPEDTPITQTPSLGPNATYSILVGVQVPLLVTLGTIDTTTVTATAVTGGATASATDTTRVGQEITVQPNNSRNAVAGSVNFYGHTVTNNSAAGGLPEHHRYLHPGLDRAAVAGPQPQRRARGSATPTSRRCRTPSI